MADIGIWGLGSMGMGMAQSLLRAGHRVAGHDVRPGVTLDGGTPLAPDAMSTAVLVVLNAAQTEEVLFGTSGIADSLAEGAVVIACATVPPAFARDMAERCSAIGLHYLDAPISGGAAKAATGQLSIMASGSAPAFAAARPALDAMAETVFELGEAGAGSAMKAVNQMLAGTHIAAMAEAMVFGMTQGVSPAQFMEVIPSCAGTSWMLENRGPHIRDGDYTPRSAVPIWLKDLGIVGEIAAAAGIEMPLTETALSRFRDAAALGLSDEDDAAVAKVYARQAGLDLP
ncbi:L-threonate dehydrogenase [uncultured Jannaschia sp.]|uniref:L-threonate dehydrogenase n=1 Tax=uncultured Jannaschia sp. TaxID=293347 RepID=UPI0026276E36|nr:L-threonate dehydrogenase [uncultured Jannaschia sp.]